LTEEVAFFQLHDKNGDGYHSKKEFYYAIMEDEFESLAGKYSKAAVDMEFEIADLNSDKKISLDEWKNVFFHEEPQEATYVDGNLQDNVDAPTEAASPPASPGFVGVATGKPQGKMHIGSEVTLSDGRKVYLSEDATWYQTQDFCNEKGLRLCLERELCPNGQPGISDEKALSELDKKKRWVPLAGRAHLWLEVRNCGLTRWPDDHTHPGLIVCCEDEPVKPPPPPNPPADKVKTPTEQEKTEDKLTPNNMQMAEDLKANDAKVPISNAEKIVEEKEEKIALTKTKKKAEKKEVTHGVKVEEETKEEKVDEEKGKKEEIKTKKKQKENKGTKAETKEEIKIEKVEKAGKKEKKKSSQGTKKKSKVKGIKAPKVA